MRIAITTLLIAAALIAPVFAGAEPPDPYDHPIVKLYEKATVHSKEVYKIPIEVRLLDINDDITWFKVKLLFYIGPVKLDYTGWTYIPINHLLAKKINKDQFALKEK